MAALQSLYSYHRPPPPPLPPPATRRHLIPSSMVSFHVNPTTSSSTTTTTTPLSTVLHILNNNRNHKNSKKISITEEDNSNNPSLNTLLCKLSPKEQTLVLKSQQHQWRNCLSLFTRIQNLENYTHNPIHYNIVLRSLSHSRRWDELRRLWARMISSVVPTNSTYSTLIDAFSRAGLHHRSIMWLKHMRSFADLVPDETTVGTVLRVLRDSGRYDDAKKFFQQWRQGNTRFDLVEVERFDFGRFDSDPSRPAHFLLTELLRATPKTSSLRSRKQLPEEEGQRIPKRPATYNILIDLYGKAGWLQDASEVFAEMLRLGIAPDTFTFNTMMHVCGSHRHLNEAESLLGKMEERQVRHDTKTFNILMSMHASAGNVSAVLMYYGKIREAGLRPDTVTYRILLQVLCENRMVGEVEEVIDGMLQSGALIDEQSMPVVMKLYVDEGLLDKAWMFFEKHCASGEVSSKVYAAMMDVYAEKGLWKEAEDVFYVKRDVSQSKDLIEYNVMIKAYGKAKLHDKALSLFESMRSCGNWPDECTYNTLIQMLSAGDLPDRAREMLVKMQEAGFRPKCKTFSAVIACYCQNSLMRKAVEVYEEMKILNIEPNEVVFGSLVDGFVESEQMEEALRYFHIMEDVGFKANRIVLTSLIKGYTKINCWKEAQELYARMKNIDGGPDVMASNCMINLYAQLGMVTEARLIFDELRRASQADGISYTTMMYLYKSMGMLTESIDLAQQLQQSDLFTDCASYNSVLASYVVSGKLRECGELLNQMIAKKLLPDDSTFKILFTVLKKGGFAPEAVCQLETMYTEGKPYARQAIFTSVFSLVGLYSIALESCNTFLTAGVALDSSAYNVAIYAYGTFGDSDKAFNLYMKMQDEGFKPDLVTYINLAASYGKVGLVEGLKRIDSLLKFGDIEPNESLFRALIRAYNAAGRDDLAEAVDQEMRFSINVEEHDEPKSEEDL